MAVRVLGPAGEPLLEADVAGDVVRPAASLLKLLPAVARAADHIRQLIGAAPAQPFGAPCLGDRDHHRCRRRLGLDKSDSGAVVLVPLQIARRLSFLPGVPVHRITALSGKGVHKLLPSLTVALGAYQARVPTRKVNDVIRSAQAAHPAPGGARVLYAAQGA